VILAEMVDKIPFLQSNTYLLWHFWLWAILIK